MKFIKILILLACVGLIGCQQKYHFFKEVEVFYSNGDRDTITVRWDGNKGTLRIEHPQPGLFGSSGGEPCLVVSFPFRSTPLACDVRRFKVLFASQVPIN